MGRILCIFENLSHSKTHMKKLSAYILLSLILLAGQSCGKDPQPVTPSGQNGKEEPEPQKPKDPEVDYDKYQLKDLAAKAGIKLGVSFTYWEYYRNTSYVSDILRNDFAAVTFGNEMKHDGIVQWDGRLVFSQADQMVRWAKDCGNELFGHTLGWHSQQKLDYLNSVIANAAKNNSASLVQRNWNFETGTLDGFVTEGFEMVPGSRDPYDVFAGDYAAKAVIDGATLQVNAELEAGKEYVFSVWAKSLEGEGTLKLVSVDGQEVQTRISTAWCRYPVTLTVASVGGFACRLVVSNDVVIDNIRIVATDGSQPSGAAPVFRPTPELAGELVNDAIGFVYRDWVYKMVEHFDVYGWDVVNETFTDWPVDFRNASNTTGDNVFVWGKYFPSTKVWVDKAFAYATDALKRYGKTAVLYLNDYNLETIEAKRTAYCNYVKGNPQVTGVGTQMHLDMGDQNLREKIEASLRDLTATGRMVRISELDIKCKDEQAQADLYKFIFEKYLEIVPEAQRGGITIWGINDKDSWVKDENHPLLYKGNAYTRKPAYETLYLYLCERAGLNPYKE
jgi:endo-1,4-beta-xylanase